MTAHEDNTIVRMLVSGMNLSVVGLGAGLVGGMFVCRAMRSMLFGVSAIDAPAITVVIGVLLLCALAACYIPARRATKVDPLVALSAGSLGLQVIAAAFGDAVRTCAGVESSRPGTWGL